MKRSKRCGSDSSLAFNLIGQIHWISRRRVVIVNSLYIMVTYLIVALLLIVVELVYFRIADKYNIIDKPNERSSHSTIVLRGGGIILAI